MQQRRRGQRGWRQGGGAAGANPGPQLVQLSVHPEKQGAELGDSRNDLGEGQLLEQGFGGNAAASGNSCLLSFSVEKPMSDDSRSTVQLASSADSGSGSKAASAVKFSLTFLRRGVVLVLGEGGKELQPVPAR
uniref:Uncharacterized protein n=1 Tax=Rangifer tarandus platyrhynchus TaxID=3082113 RepID=A0ACB0FNF8_RANTA|nr:unnamed protein product [Rangifer tarandus platyrhynchus]